MKFESFIFFVFICLFGSACSPKISTRITKIYPPQASDAYVAVYTREQDVPPQSEPIGTVDIGDTGFTANCDSATVFSMAKTETRKAGGNAFLVTQHLRPSFIGGSCHQISGTMLLVSGFSQIENIVPESTPFVQTPRQNNVQPSQTPSAETITFVQTDPVVANYRPSRQFPRMSFMLDAGYNWRNAKIDDDLNNFEKHIMKQVKSGFLWNGSMAYYFKNYFGVGLSFQQFRASHEAFATDLGTGNSGVFKINDRITYIGPAYMMQVPLGRSNLLLDVCMSIGYIEYTSKQNFANEKIKVSGATVGAQAEVGISYKITPQWAIGCKMLSTAGALFQYTVENNGHKTTEKLEDKAESLMQIGISLGIRHYIKSK